MLDFRRHCESMECDEKTAYEAAKADAIDTIDSSFKVMKEVVERKYHLKMLQNFNDFRENTTLSMQ